MGQQKTRGRQVQDLPYYCSNDVRSIGFESRADSMDEPRSILLLRKRAEAIVWVRTQMARHGLSFNDLVTAGCFAWAPRPVRYRNAQGQTWDGEGAMPDWLQRVVNAGQSPEHFRL